MTKIEIKLRKYLQDREGRDLLAAECRRTELLIGKLLGPGEQTWTGKPTTSPTGEVVEVPKDDLYKFRLMAKHEPLVEECLADGKVSRNVILEKIQRRENVEELVEDQPEIREDPLQIVSKPHASSEHFYDTVAQSEIIGSDVSKPHASSKHFYSRPRKSYSLGEMSRSLTLRANIPTPLMDAIYGGSNGVSKPCASGKHFQI